ncbi:glutamate--tRNA ligase [Bacteroidetes bacterium SCGC AAA795-G10]|nr:glutamate--tRNA ligase [Bacteroidetes bacterium SCGC AAA795-G10]
MKIRVRFAPSPTGPLHIGGLRTALFNYLYAKSKKGSFILRIEDTDQNRYVEGSENYLIKALNWCGIKPDEGPNTKGNFGPYRQSERKKIYKEHIDKLINLGAAYYAFDSEDQLKKYRQEDEKNGKTFLYGSQNRIKFRNSLTLNLTETKKALEGDYVVRLKVMGGAKVSVNDEIRGNISVSTDLLDDKILLKSDGLPTYHFANVVDDKLMEITDVIRGEEWLPSLPIHKLIYDAFNWNLPRFMHLPLILKPNGKGKLSKRDGLKDGYPVFPIKFKELNLGFKERGFLSEGMVNYLALLGWNSGTENEIFNLSDLIKYFSIKRVQKGGARFDYEKACWINQQHISKSDVKTLMEQKIVRETLEKVEEKKRINILNLVKNRLKTLNDLKNEIRFLDDPQDYDKKSVIKLIDKNPVKIMDQIIKLLNSDIEIADMKQSLFEWGKNEKIPFGLIMQTLRLAIIGQLSGPDLFKICALIGKNVSLKRVQKFKTFCLK